MGMSWLVCLAALMAAILAVVRASPFLSCPARSFDRTSGCMVTMAVATAFRVVTSLSETSTIRACPCLSRCERGGLGWSFMFKVLMSDFR